VSATMTEPTEARTEVDPAAQRRVLADLRKAAEKMDEWHAKRDQLVIEAKRQRLSLRQIGGACNMSAPGVNRIVHDGPYGGSQDSE